MSTFDAIFRQFKTWDTIKVSISGSDATFELLPTESWARALAKKRGSLETAGELKKRALPTGNKKVVVMNNKPAETDNDDEVQQYMLGTAEKDIEFFIEHVLCGWSGIVDENGSQIEFSRENAKKHFDSSKPEVYRLVNTLWLEALNEENFVKTDESQEVEEAVKK